ncbi:MAG: putative deoxyribonuclease YcfH [Candidatus Dependentiae bacterium ADurb.Bin331]|nr:MAG: putative deoxyribonuclease YcfH [Candidatus Dependentiae bacterium ADurb.Bin331]
MQNNKTIEKNNLELIDTHCHINIMVKKNFDTSLTQEHLADAKKIVDQAIAHRVTRIINVGTSVIESKNCVLLAQTFNSCFAAVGIHPNDCTSEWKNEVKEIEKLILNDREKRIVAIGECGLDFHYPDFDVERQKDAFRAQIELALNYDLPLIVHTRAAAQETLGVIDEFRDKKLRGVIHCFSEDLAFAQECIARSFVLGIGGTLTYPKNEELRRLFSTVALESIILETDAPYLPIQPMRGKENHPMYIDDIAKFLAQLRNETIEKIAYQTTFNSLQLFSTISE